MAELKIEPNPNKDAGRRLIHPAAHTKELVGTVKASF